MNTCEDRWERFLDPDVVRPSLFMATMFITAFEILKNSIVDHLRDFYTFEWSEQGGEISSEYKAKVLSRNRSPVYASLNWLLEHQVINANDFENFEQIKSTRNLVAHQLFNIVAGQTESRHMEQFPILIDLLKKIEVWWIVNVENATHLDHVNKKEIIPSAILSLQMLLEVASGNRELLDAWVSLRTKDFQNT